MGCTASRPAFDDELCPEQHQLQHDCYHPKGISMPAALHTHNPSLHDFNIVPLSSSTYGINMKVADLEVQKLFGHGNPAKDGSMKEMLQVLDSLDMGSAICDASAPPASIFDDLKPGLEKHFNQALGKPYKAEPIVSRQIQGKENAKPPPRSPSTGANSPIRQKGSASPVIKPSKSKGSFASRFLKRSSSMVGSQTIEGATDDQDETGGRKSEAGGSLFDADFLASYESALKELTPDDWNALKNDPEQRQQFVNSTKGERGEMLQPQPKPETPTPVKKKREDLLDKYEKLCPPGGENSVVLYTTSLRGIRKTFEDCNNLRSVLESFQVCVDERDVAMHQGFRNELREMMGNKPVPVPRLFIKGRYIGGAEDVLQLHEEEQLAPLLQGVPRDERGSTQPCDGCGGARFVPCMDCSGSRKVVNPDNPREVIRCPDCNENGLIQCPICS